MLQISTIKNSDVPEIIPDNYSYIIYETSLDSFKHKYLQSSLFYQFQIMPTIIADNSLDTPTGTVQILIRGQHRVLVRMSCSLMAEVY